MHRYFSSINDIKKCVVCLGFFDGVHIGHRELIKKAKSQASSLGVPCVVYTFENHPRTLIFPEEKTKCIYTNEEKESVFDSLGVDAVIFEDFSLVRDLSPSEFVERILIERLGALHAVCGYNFRFGKDNAGDTDTLASCLSPHGAKLSVIPPVCAGDLPVSSARIRALLEVGDIETANLLLNRCFSVGGRVVHGHRIGHELGFPTANIVFPSSAPELLRGVYFTKTHFDGAEYLSVTNIGVRPTVRDGVTEPVCETYIIDFDSDIYDKCVRIEFHKMSRPETCFSSLDELKSVLKRDVEEAIKYFENKEEKA